MSLNMDLQGYDEKRGAISIGSFWKTFFGAGSPVADFASALPYLPAAAAFRVRPIRQNRR